MIHKFWNLYSPRYSMIQFVCFWWIGLFLHLVYRADLFPSFSLGHTSRPGTWSFCLSLRLCCLEFANPHHFWNLGRQGSSLLPNLWRIVFAFRFGQSLLVHIFWLRFWHICWLCLCLAGNNQHAVIKNLCLDTDSVKVLIERLLMNNYLLFVYTKQRIWINWFHWN